jgi:hypothetical protein
LLDVAAICGVSGPAVHGWKGRSKPTTENLKLLAEHYNVTVDYLLGQDPERVSHARPVDPIPTQTRELPVPYHCQGCADREAEVARWRHLCESQASTLQAQAETIRTLSAGVCHYPTAAPASPKPRVSSRAS